MAYSTVVNLEITTLTDLMEMYNARCITGATLFWIIPTSNAWLLPPPSGTKLTRLQTQSLKTSMGIPLHLDGMPAFSLWRTSMLLWRSYLPNPLSLSSETSCLETNAKRTWIPLLCWSQLRLHLQNPQDTNANTPWCDGWRIHLERCHES